MRDLHGFDLVALYTDCKRSLNCIDRDDQSLVPTARKKYAFQPIESTAPNSHPLTNLQVRVRSPRKTCFHQTANGIDLVIRYRRAFALRTDQAEYSFDAKNP